MIALWIFATIGILFVTFFFLYGFISFLDGK